MSSCFSADNALRSALDLWCRGIMFSHHGNQAPTPHFRNSKPKNTIGSWESSSLFVWRGLRIATGSSAATSQRFVHLPSTPRILTLTHLSHSPVRSIVRSNRSSCPSSSCPEKSSCWSKGRHKLPIFAIVFHLSFETSGTYHHFLPRSERGLRRLSAQPIRVPESPHSVDVISFWSRAAGRYLYDVVDRALSLFHVL